MPPLPVRGLAQAIGPMAPIAFCAITCIYRFYKKDRCEASVGPKLSHRLSPHAGLREVSRCAGFPFTHPPIKKTTPRSRDLPNACTNGFQGRINSS